MTRTVAFRSAVVLTALLALACGSKPAEEPITEAAACPEVAKLAVLSSTPSNGQSGVSMSASITVRFNTCLDESTVKAPVVSLVRTAGKVLVEGSVRYDAAQAAVVFTPAKPLAPSAYYGLLFTPELRSSRGLALENGGGVTFSTRSAPETVPPTTAFSPAAGHYNTPQTVTLSCQDNPGGTGCVGTFYTLDGSTPTSSSARYGAPLTVERSLTLRFFSVDGDGNTEAPQSVTYVIDTVAPRVVSTLPADGATDVRVDTLLRVGFDEAMKEATLTEAPTRAPLLDSTFAYEAAAHAIVRTPTERLQCATRYAVTVPTTVADLAGNTLAAPATFHFTTSADCAEPRTSASLASGAYAQERDVTLTCDDGAGGSGCARLVYTLDGSLPSFAPLNGTVVSGATAGPLHLGPGETRLRFRAEDAAGHLEVVRERRYSVSTTGFTWVAAVGGLARGVGPVPEHFVTLRSSSQTRQFFRDTTNGRLYRLTNPNLTFTDDGIHYERLPVGGGAFGLTSIAAQGARLYVGSSEGLHVSTDGGATFQDFQFGLYDDRVSHVVASGLDVYVGTSSGLLVSNDRFHTWRGSVAGVVRDVKVDGDTVYVALASGVRVSRDRGGTWEAPALPAGAGAPSALSSAGSQVYVACEGGLAISSDRGASFPVLRTTAAALDGNPVQRVLAEDGYLYVATWVPASSATGAFFVSSNGGTTFTRKRIPGGSRDVTASTLFAEGADLYVGAYPSAWLSRDHGSSFALMGPPSGAVSRVVGSGATVYVAVQDSSGWPGISVSQDNGTTFRFVGLEQGLPDGSVDDLFLDGTVLYAGTWRGLAISRDGARTFDVRTQANSGLAQSTAAAVWASGATVWTNGPGQTQRSTNSGVSFQDRVTGISPTALTAAGTDVYVGTWSGIHVSNNGGTSFVLRDAAAGLPSSGGVQDLAVAADGRLYAAASSALYASADRGMSFAPVALPSGLSASTVNVSGGHLYVSGSSLAISADGGASFVLRDAAQGLPGNVKDVRYLAP